MVLGFMTKFPWGESTQFREKILLGHLYSISDEAFHSLHEIAAVTSPKLHTIREGQRWKEGQLAHMATGVRTKHYNQFNKEIPELQTIKSMQRIDIFIRSENCILIFIDRKLFYRQLYWENEKGKAISVFNAVGFEQFLKNDGLTKEQFFRFFKKSLRNGQLLHFTDLKY